MKKHKKITSLLLAAMMTLCMIPGSAFADEISDTSTAEETVIETEETEEETALMTEIEETSAGEEYVSDETITEIDSVEETLSETIAETTEAVPDNETDLADPSDEVIETAEETVPAETETEEAETVEEVAAEEVEIAVKAMNDVATGDVVASGTCGTNVSWTLTGDKSNGYTLTISGSGNMYNYSSSSSSVPWYSYKDNIKDVEILTGVTSIGNWAFYNCSSLASITIPDSVTSIGSSAFYDCSSLTSITIPEGVTSVESSAFSNCSSLTSITIPEGVTSIGNYAFSNCSSLTSIIIPDSVTSIGSSAFSNCSSLTSIIIPDGVTSIGNYAFRGCSSLTSITIPEGVTSIGAYAFRGCSSLTSIIIPDGVTSIGNYAFRGCSSLTSITIPDSVTSIGDCAFYDCSSLTSITIPDSVTSIGQSAFSGCSSLASITIPESVTSIGNRAFYYCNNLTSITIPEGVTSIGSYAFYGCSKLAVITIPEGVTSIGDYVFYGCSSLTSITILEGVTTIGDYAFYGCSSLASITIPEGVTSIGDYAFCNCNSLTSITFPKSVASIGWSAFEDCKGLTSIALPDGISYIGEGAFRNCSNLTSITIPKITNIEYFEYFGDEFRGCKKLSNFYIKSIKDWLDFPIYFNDSPTKHLIMEGSEISEIIIPDGISNIRHYAFSGCRELTSIFIPNSVTSIGGSAFSDCSNLTSITIPKNLNDIESKAFSHCTNLLTCFIYGTDVKLKEDTFDHCDNITIYCPPDSTVIAYADRLGIPCITDALPTGTAITKITNLKTGSAVQWKKSENVSGYYIYRKIGNGSYALAETITSAATLKWTDTAAKTNGTKYTYYVVPYHDMDGTIYEGARSEEIVSYYVAQPTISSITPDTNNGLKVTWSKNDKATGYYVYRKSGSESYKKLATVTGAATLNWTDTSSKTNGTKYTYCVVAYKTVSGTTYRSASDLSKDVCFVSQPAISSVAAVTNSGLKVTWGKNAQASGYYIYRKTGSGSYSKVKTITTNATVTWTDTGAKTNGTGYAYYVIAYKTVDGTTYQSAKSAVKTFYYVAQPTVSSVAAVTNKGLKVTWAKNAKATGYYIYRRTGSGSYSKVKTITSNSTVTWTDTGAKTNGTGYTYYVIAYKTVSGVNYQSAKSAVKAYYFLTYPVISSVKNTAKGKMTVVWNKNAKANGYQVKYVTGTTTKTVTVSGNSNVKRVISSLVKGKTYNVYVRSYKTVSGTNYYSDWSAVKSVKITK